MKLNPKQKRFCVEYLKDLNATQAAIRTGYSKKTAYSQGQRMLKKVEIQNYIKQLRADQFKKDIATAEEVEAMLSRTLRGELEEEIVVVKGIGEGCSEAKIMKKQVSMKERVRAAEILAKRHQLFSSDTNINITPIVFTGEDELNE